MQQRRLRLGDILDDYCPRERRVTNHVVVAMIDDAVKQTRCATCEADHEYKNARVPPRRKPAGGVAAAAPDDRGQLTKSGPAAQTADGDGWVPPESEHVVEAAVDTERALPAESPVIEDDDSANIAAEDDDGPVHRPLIRATLPRPEGQGPERKEPDFTVRQSGGRGGREDDGNRVGGHRHRGPGRRMRSPGGAGGPGGQPARFGGPRHGSTPPDDIGNRAGGRPHQGQGRRSRPGGHGRKRGR